MIITNTTFITALADIEGEQNTGGGGSNLKSSSAYTWSVNQSGYRFVIVNQNFQPVSKVVDALFRNISGFSFGKNDVNLYTNPRTSLTLSNSKTNWMYTTFDILISQGVIPSGAKPPQPIITDPPPAKGTGEEFKKWFLSGSNVITAQNAPVYTPPSSSSSGGTKSPTKGSSGSSSGSSSSKSSGGNNKTNKNNVKDAPLYSVSTLMSSPYTRKWIVSYYGDLLIEQGLAEHAATLTMQYKATFNYRVIAAYMAGFRPEKEAQKEALRDLWRDLGYVARSNIERMIVFIGVINYELGNGWMAYGNTIYLDGTYFASLAIPLSGSSNKGYVYNILNWKYNGKYVFDFSGRNSNETVTDAMVRLGYSVIVEPIFWFIPARANSSGLPTSPKHGNYVYGTVTNHIQFAKSKGYKFGQSGGAYTSVYRVGSMSMYIRNDVRNEETNAVILRAFTGSTTEKRTLSQLDSLIRNAYGIGIHYYMTSPTPGPTKEPEKDPDPTNLELTESQITKAISTLDSLPGWGSREFSFSRVRKYDSKGNEITPSGSFKFIIKNINDINSSLEANTTKSELKPRMLNNTKSGSIYSNHRVSITSAEYQTVIWRANDIPTLAGYKVSSSHILNSLLGRIGNIPKGSRRSNGSYEEILDIRLGLSDSESYGLDWYSYNSYAPAHSAKVKIDVFAGDGDKHVGDLTEYGMINTTIPFGSNTSKSAAGYMVQNQIPIKFYPYIRMTYQTIGQKSQKQDVYVLSQNISEILPNDFVEVGWYNPDTESLKIGSTQWSMHARATNGSKGWNKPNQVLPGGAIYYLSTGETPTQVAIVTWQTIMVDPERSALAESLPTNEYTLAKAQTEHNNLVNQARNILNEWHIVQWVNADVNAEYAWKDNGKAVKVTGGGVSLKPLGLNGTTSSDAKYHLVRNSGSNKSNEGDLDIINQSSTIKTYFKVFADTSGNIYLAQSNDLNALKNKNGQNTSNDNKVTVTKILDKTVKPNEVWEKLTDSMARNLEQRTKLISNFVGALERNKGNDHTASWATSDGRWYNEAFDGIYVVRQATYLTVGFKSPDMRASALDPKLCPPKSSRSEMFERAFLSQFRLEAKSDAAQDKGVGYIGTFKGQDVYLPSIQNMYISKKFYIPNVNVQDLGN
jgi:hypothetical protein